MKPLKLLLYALVILFLPVSHSMAGDASTPTGKCHKLRVVGHPYWKVVSAEKGNTGEIIGVGPDFIKIIGKNLGIPVEFGPLMPWKRVMVTLEQGEADLVSAAFYSDKRAEFAVFSDGYLDLPLSAVIKIDNPLEIKELADLKGLKGVVGIGNYLGKEFEDYSKDNLDITSSSADDRNFFEMIARGRADYHVVSELTYRRKVVEYGFQDKTKSVILPVPPNQTRIMISKKSPCRALLGKINSIIAEARQTGLIESLVKKNISLSLEK